MKLGQIILVLLISAALLILLWPVHPGGHGAPSTTVLSQMKQATLGNVLYYSDHDDRLPPIEWRSAVRPYIKSPKIFEDRAFEIPYIFAHRATLVGTKVSAVEEPAQTAMLLDVFEASDPYVAELPALAFRKGRSGDETFGLVGRVDGSAKRYSPTSAEKIR